MIERATKFMNVDLGLSLIWMTIQYFVQPAVWHCSLNVLQHWLSYFYCIVLIFEIIPLLLFCRYFIKNPQQAKLRFGALIHDNFWILDTILAIVLLLIIISDFINIV